MQIIIADDDQVSRSRVTSLIETFGHEARVFSNGTAAWEAFEREPARIVIADWKMPGLDGLDLCRKIRRRPRTEYVYFLLVTAAEPGELGYDYEIGADVDDFIIKPVSRSALWRRLRVAERMLKFTTEIRQLQGLLPICMYCHKIRDEDSESWESVERYVAARTGSSFSHGICPDCMKVAEKGLTDAGF